MATAQAPKFTVGSLVTVRDRDWIVLPTEYPDILKLRPLSGVEGETCGISLALEKGEVQPAQFQAPSPHSAGDFIAGRLLRDAARLGLRSGAGPFRSLGRLSVRPRPYQFVPLIMALRLDPVRLLIADDVGIGKTIEAGMITRELLDRGDVRRTCVLCPPHLCDQWQTELERKFHIPAVILRTSTLARLERDLPRRDLTVYEYYPHLVVSIDFVKTDRRRDAFLAHCPDLVIVDEEHTATEPGGIASREQQLRHELVHGVSKNPERNLILVTATPHSGIEHSFRSLLGLLSPTFEKLDMQALSDKQREVLAKHFVQRRRADVTNWLGETHFPKRISEEATYKMGREYLELFDDVLEFTREIVQDTSLTAPRRRVRWWAALSMLRSLMSSPEAAIKSFEARHKKLAPEADETTDETRNREVLDAASEGAIFDMVPESAVEVAMPDLPEKDRRRLKEFARKAETLKADDPKLAKAEELVTGLLRQGAKPILYCRFVATAEYVARELQKRLEGRFKDLRVMGITSETGNDEEREAKVAELVTNERRVLVATDCLSEGINLQDHFDSVIHYDLPWNPNRLEQREGRVDRFGQVADEVHAILLFSPDNRIDGIVLNVLLNKAREIFRSLGVSVPVPMDSATVGQAVFNALLEAKGAQQMTLGFTDMEIVQSLHKQWDRDAEREKVSRTKFAQHAIKPGEVAQELEKTDDVLGDPTAVRKFLIDASQRLDFSLKARNGHFVIDPANLKPELRDRLRWKKPVNAVFDSPPPKGMEDAEVIVRNHPLVVALAEKILGGAFSTKSDGKFARSGAAFTDTIQKRTVVLLARIRYCLSTRRKQTQLFAEEIVTLAFHRQDDKIAWSAPNDENTLTLLEEVVPKGSISQQERVEQVRWANERIEEAKSELNAIADARAVELAASHERLRQQTGGTKIEVTAHHPPDVLGVYVLLPGGGRQ